MAELLLGLGVLLVLVGVCLWCVLAGLAQAARARERARIEHEAQDASWRIHQQANQAFSDMLRAARESRGPEP